MAPDGKTTVRSHFTTLFRLQNVKIGFFEKISK